MSAYAARIKETQEGSFYAFIVLKHKDGYEQVLRGYKSRHFASMKAAEKSISNYLAKI
jgi:hypothetical protein